MTGGLTSDGITSDSSSAFANIRFDGMAGVLFLATHSTTIGEGTNISISVAYSTTGEGSDATTSTDIWSASNAVLTFTTALGLAGGAVRSLWVDVDLKGLSSQPGYFHVWIAANDASVNAQVIAIPWPQHASLPLYSVSVTAA